MSRCKSCGKPIVWVKTAAGRNIPINPGMVDGGNIVIEGDPNPVARVVEAGAGKFVTHFTDCEFSDLHRRKRHWSENDG